MSGVLPGILLTVPICTAGMSSHSAGMYWRGPAHSSIREPQAALSCCLDYTLLTVPICTADMGSTLCNQLCNALSLRCEEVLVKGPCTWLNWRAKSCIVLLAEGRETLRMDCQCRRREFSHDNTSENTFLHLSVLQHGILLSTTGAQGIPWNADRKQ